ncbi:DUF1217 domain-containing protein [Agrobacterium larrymoorei]|nr:DUF1217 domain-containing protein [Agrobacterium larrymoorei]
MAADFSTYTGFLMVNRDMKSSLQTVANQSAVARDTEYYKERIGSITSVDDFLDDYRLYSYAMKAYGLEEMTYAKAFMRRVLESDLKDTSSFANTLTDKRYLQFAEAFNFSGDTKTAQNSAQAGQLTDAYRASFTTEQTNIETESDFFQRQIGSVGNVDDLVNNTRLRTYVLDAVGLDPVFTSKEYLKQVLTSDLDDPNSVANQAQNPAWKKLTAAFNFNADGSINGSAQTADQTEDLGLDYVFNKSTFPSDLLRDSNQRYWEKNVAKVTTAGELTSDPRLLDYVKTAFKLSNTIMPGSVASLMSSENFANVYGNTQLLDYFNFESDGTLANGNSAQDATQFARLAGLYRTSFADSQTADVDDAISNYETRIAGVKTLDDFFISNRRDEDRNNDNVTEVWDVALRAFGIDADQVTQSQLKRILSSDLNDRNSYVNTLRDERFVNLVKAFNFTPGGELGAPVIAQSESITNNFATDYVASKVRFLTGPERDAATKKANTEVDYFKEQMLSVKSAREMLADNRLKNFVLEANGIDPESVTTADLQRMFTSDLSDPRSSVNTQENGRFAEIVASFNFDATGAVSETAAQGIQQRGAVLETTNRYAQQTLEEQQGNTNPGVRLALYFERTAPTVGSAFTILSDDALFEFFRTAYSLPQTIANMDVSKQADLVRKYMDVERLQDPDYVTSLVKRFTALYDLQNSSTASPALSIMNGGASINPDTLLAVAQLSSR